MGFIAEQAQLCPGNIDIFRLTEYAPLERQHLIAAKHQRVRILFRNLARLHLGQSVGNIMRLRVFGNQRSLDRLFINARRNCGHLKPRVPQKL